MSEPIVWENIPKSQADPTTIEEAIAEGIDAHNADSEAHMADLEAIAEHRENDIIDHPAESVVNDKIALRARQFIAIVDPDSDTDFDTVSSAIDYAHDNGGGNVLVVPGDHYLSGITAFPGDVNLYGVDPDTCFIHTGTTSVDLFEYDWVTPVNAATQIVEGLTFVNEGEGVFTGDGNSYDSITVGHFNSCKFEGFYAHFFRTMGEINFNDCTFQYPYTGGIFLSNVAYFRNCDIQPSTVAQPHTFIKLDTDEAGEMSVYMYDTTIAGRGGSNNQLWEDSSLIVLNLVRCNVSNWIGNNLSGGSWSFEQSTFTLATSGYILIPGGSAFLFRNLVLGGTGNKIRVGSGVQGSIIIFNSCGTLITDDGTGSLILYNSFSAFSVLSNSATAMGLGLVGMVQLTPNSSRTLTTTVPPAGDTRTIKFLTSGSSSYTMTFGSGFKEVGTLATGATTSRIFIIRFISDGSNLIEMSRTTAIVA